ncbi:MAG: phosphate transporter substrate-binding protein [Ilumatobacteraceae bacterium]|nr:phosphate transporter substrate-binding protein [Ilumatobacteraceae bacterium]
MTGVGPPGLASLGMYPFEGVRWAYDRYWEAVRERLDWGPASLDWDVDLHQSWLRDDLVIGHTCGWPLVTELRDRVRVVGTFVAATPEAEDYSYRSVLLATRPGQPSDFVGCVAAVNSLDSLSGWISLRTAVHGAGAAWQGDVVVTGAHVDSVRALREGRAEIASIDSITAWHVRRLMPELLDGLVQVGTGPLVPCLPVITSGTATDEQLRDLRIAMVEAVFDPLVEPAARAMCTTGFVALDLRHYMPLLELSGLHSDIG